MKTNSLFTGALLFALSLCPSCKIKKADQTPLKNYLDEPPAVIDQRMAWWRDARFGMFIHWGLYAIPAGEWNGETNHAEWIRTTAQIPVETYDSLVYQFNPVDFNADKWVKLAKDAGMKYIVITSKHHDGFCLFDSRETEFDVMSTPFHRDILKELAYACERENIRLCFYHSIMDWHHPDYLPRRSWETDRSTEGTDFSRYVVHLKKQLRELTSNYGNTGVLWFDGEWEDTWTHEMGVDLYNYVRNLKPDIIINNRVDKGRNGMAGMTSEGFAGDFGTPEQEIPATGLPGTDWESCMTMNDHWGYNKADKNFKSSKDLIRKLVDIASKGGNFLLNVGPTAKGVFPAESIDRLHDIGKWMKLNGESIYGTTASPFAHLDWGRCTKKLVGGNTYLYLHVFDQPPGGQLVLNGVANEPVGAQFLAYPSEKLLPVERHEDALTVQLPPTLPDPVNTVVVLALKGKPDIHNAPVTTVPQDIFVHKLSVPLLAANNDDEITYTTTGTMPTAKSTLYKDPIPINETTTITARIFRGERPVSAIFKKTFKKVVPAPGQELPAAAPGLQYLYFEGNWNKLPDFSFMKPLKTGAANGFDRSAMNEKGEHYGFEFRGFVRIPEDEVYTFYTESDDGSRLWIDQKMVVDNDGLHGMHEASGIIALGAGLHEIWVRYFEKTGGDDLKVFWETATSGKSEIPTEALFHIPEK
ncbi:MAG: alpha-L-fucosidase [Saprospiraceae bacterium]